MQYTKPLNETNLNAGYRDAVPAQGIKGSTVPASAIEAPQREIVNVISSAGLTPSDADNTQLTQAIDGKINAAKEGKADVDLSNLSVTGQAVLDAKADVDAGNFTAAGKRAIVGWGSPDYTAAVDYTSNWGSVITTQKRGWLWVRGNAYAGSTPVYLTIGNVSFNVVENGATSSGTGSGAFFRIPPTQFQVTGGNGYARQIIFFPCMGA